MANAKQKRKKSARPAVFEKLTLGTKVVTYYPLFGGKYNGHLVQHEEVAQAIQNRQLELVAEFNELEVGLEELGRAIKKARATGALLVFSRLGYLSRNLKFLKYLANNAPDVVFVALDDHTRFNSVTFPIYLEQADSVWHERRNRVKDGMAKAKKRGAKFGTRRPGALTKEFREAEYWRLAIAESARARGARTNDAYALLIPKIIEMRKAGEGWPAIAEFLNEEGHRTTTGAPFSAPTVLRIIKRNARQGGQGDPARREGMGRPRIHAAVE